jgi:TPR repeat protein
MVRLLTTALLIVTSLISFGQTPDELNVQSKTFLSNGDAKNAVPLLKRAAELGQPEAQYNFGYCFQQGIQVEKNDSIANIWFLASAKQGYVNAQFKMAYSYLHGRGIQKDNVQALFWAIKCAKQNDPECMSDIVNYYYQGIGTTKNLDSSVTWTIRLASLPDIENLRLSGIITSARKSLATDYLDSGGLVRKDKIKSYMWFLIYNESKRDFSIIEQQSNIDSIKELEKSLTQSDKNKAKSEAERQIKRKLKNLENLYKQDL